MGCSASAAPSFLFLLAGEDPDECLVDEIPAQGFGGWRHAVHVVCLRRLLAPIFEPQFHENSYGFIPGRNCHQAIERVLELHRQGYQVVLDADIQGFFDNLSHRVIMAAVAAEVADGNILNLVERFLTRG